MFLTRIILGVVVLVFGSGCATVDSSRLLPSEEKEAVGFSSFDEALQAFEEIKMGDTSRDELAAIGFDTLHSTNTEVLTYTDVLAVFMHSPNIGKEDLPPGVLECLKAKSGCQAYRFRSEQQDEVRYGNFFIDLLNFRKRKRTTGFRFDALVVMVNDVVEHALYSGEKNINLNEVKRNPLGPLQNMDISNARKAAGY